MICYTVSSNILSSPFLLQQRHPFFIDKISFELMQKTHLLQGYCTKTGPSKNSPKRKKRVQVFYPQASIVIFSVDASETQSIWVPLSFSEGEWICRECQYRVLRWISWPFIIKRWSPRKHTSQTKTRLRSFPRKSGGISSFLDFPFWSFWTCKIFPPKSCCSTGTGIWKTHGRYGYPQKKATRCPQPEEFRSGLPDIWGGNFDKVSFP